ncbi:MAG: CHAT domain-containing protein [Nitrospirae bacterium]|nr:CHAT domain-containing protein [Nitrospirota bacterium]MBF0618103.1 CHAT domain-containing protein [Nitrospirota bacterium]
MVQFFSGLKAGKTKLAAMKDAKDYLRANGYENPFYWAPFIVMGEVQ